MCCTHCPQLRLIFIWFWLEQSVFKLYPNVHNTVHPIRLSLCTNLTICSARVCVCVRILVCVWCVLPWIFSNETRKYRKRKSVQYYYIIIIRIRCGIFNAQHFFVVFRAILESCTDILNVVKKNIGPNVPRMKFVQTANKYRTYFNIHRI